MTFKHIYLLLLTFFFVACGTPDTPQKQSTIPSWYLNPPANNQFYLYGEGDGADMQEAKINALNTMAGKLSVEISSSMINNTNTYTNGIVNTYDKSISKTIQQDIKKIDFTNIKTLKAINQNYRYYVLLQVDKEQLITIKKEQFLLLDKRINEIYTSSLHQKPFEQIQTIYSLYNMINEAKEKLNILKILQNSFNAKQYLTKYNTIQDKINTLKKTTPLGLSSNQTNKYFQNKLADLLGQSHYVVQNNNDVSIKLDSQIRYSKAYGWDVTKVNTNITLKSYGKIIANKNIESLGKSSSSQENALTHAALHFKQQIENMGIDTILFSK